jgi:crotonobetaine/carnitine-CoA ligase
MNRLDLSQTQDRTFPRILRAQAQQNGDTDFLLNDEMRVSFAQADELTNRLASGLEALGVGRGDRVAIYMGNRPEFVLLTLAINKLGAIWVPINTDYKGEWLLDSVERSRCRVFVTDTQCQPHVLPLREQLDIPHWVSLTDAGAELPAGLHSYESLEAAEPLDSDYADQDYGDVCAILWTSGTTGKSKGVLQNYNGWIRAIDQGASPMFDSHRGDVIYCALPLFHTGAWITSVHRALLEGIPCVIEPRFSVHKFWERIALFQATQTFLVGAMGVFLWNAPEREDDSATSLRKAMIVPFSPDIWTAFEERFGLEILTGGLGMSECQLIANQLGAQVPLPPYSLGYPPADIELRLCDDDGNEVPPGESGEMCVKPLAPHVLFNGYFDDEKATANAYRGEWFLTGDMARRDPDNGALFFVDRKKDAVRFAGRNISTLEVEGVFRRHPAVSDVAAFGIPSAEIESEDELKVNIVLKDGESLSAEDICSFVNDNAPHYFVPRYIDFVDALPYTPTNKVQKFVLREQGVTASTWDQKTSDYKVRR